VTGDSPDTRFVVAPDGAHIAFQTVGDGERDLVLVTDWASSIDLMWEQPRIARFLTRLASIGRLILFDKRGNGASDGLSFGRGEFGGAMEQASDDLLAVLDAAESERVDLVGSTFGGFPAMLFAATHPERCDRLVLQDSCPRFLSDGDYDGGLAQATLEAITGAVGKLWGRGVTLSTLPDLYGDPALRRWYGRYERLAIDRTLMLQAWQQMTEIDARPVLPSIQASTLVIAHDRAFVVGQGAGRYLTEHIPTAELVELDGVGEMFWADERIIEHIVRFLGAESDETTDEDRVLATIVFTDLVASTPKLAELGDRRWKELLDEHDARTERLVSKFRGRLVQRTGDGLLATFDGPARGVRCAQAICNDVGELGVEVRSGVHVGEIELRGEHIGGIAVHLAARVMAKADAGEVVVTRTVKDLTAGSGLAFEDRGLHELKGIPEPWQLLALAN
jgi:class 3 adenylate cyclase/pimeloyl-ACP methyl ester carboxylesterase